MAATVIRRAPYKDFLQPALHRRFSFTAFVLLFISFFVSLLLDSWTSYFWAIFPFGPTGVRTSLIFTCGLAILILRIANYHVGLRTTSSGFQTISATLLRLETYETLFWYGFSSMLFSFIFLWAMPNSSNLRWITYFSGDRARLNERPLFLTCYLGSCAIIQTIEHYTHDIDRLVLGLSKNKKNSGDSLEMATANAPGIVLTALKLAIKALPATLVSYFLVLRSFAWGWALVYLRLFYNLPKTNMLPPSWPTDIFLLLRCVYAGFLLFIIWTAGNFAFSTFMVKEPLKNGKPLTWESKDPNGSILNGLKSKKLSIKAFAMWELAYIAQDFETRRQAIYQDIDRKDGPMWSQVYTICMDVIKSIETRIDNFGKSPAPAPAAAVVPEQRHRVSAPLHNDPIFTSKAESKSMRGEVEKRFGQFARDPVSPPASTKLGPLAKKGLKEAKDRVFSKEQQEALGSFDGKFDQLKKELINVDFVATLFQQDFRTRFAAAVLGTPYAEPTLCINAIHVLCQLSVHSLAEDQFGNVHRDVPSIIRTFTSVIKKLEDFKLGFEIHWTDTKGLRDCPEVDEVLAALRRGLGHILEKFEPYSTDLRLSLTDVRLAREAATEPQVEERVEMVKSSKREKRPDMQQVR